MVIILNLLHQVDNDLWMVNVICSSVCALCNILCIFHVLFHISFVFMRIKSIDSAYHFTKRGPYGHVFVCYHAQTLTTNFLLSLDVSIFGHGLYFLTSRSIFGWCQLITGAALDLRLSRKSIDE